MANVGDFRATWQGVLDRLSGTSGKAQVQDADVRAAINALKATDFSTKANQDALQLVADKLLLDTTVIKGKDFATQATLEALLAKVTALETEVQSVKANQLSGDQKVQLSGTNVSYSFGYAVVTTVSVIAVPSNVNRKYLLVINDSDTPIYIAMSTTPAANARGIRLNANGGSYEMSIQNGNLAVGSVLAIHGGVGNKVLLYTEGV